MRYSNLLEDIKNKLTEIGIVPTLVVSDEISAVSTARALCSGGIRTAEVTYRTPAAESAIRAISENVPQCLVGAGTVLSIEQVKSAVAAGAQYVVSPGLNSTVVNYCLEKNIPIIPGVETASEIEQGMALGLKYFKFFPAEASGGYKKIQALCSPYPTVAFLPTGGINEDNMALYLAQKNVFACGGSWVCTPKWVKNSQFEKIIKCSQKTMDKIREQRNLCD